MKLKKIIVILIPIFFICLLSYILFFDQSSIKNQQTDQIVSPENTVNNIAVKEDSIKRYYTDLLPKLDLYDTTYNKDIPEKIKQYIKREYPTYYFPNVNRLANKNLLDKSNLNIDNPFYITGDFNNDNNRDYALVIANNTPINRLGYWALNYRIVVLNGNDDSTVTEVVCPPRHIMGSVIENPYARSIFIALLKFNSGKNEMTFFSENKELLLKHETLGLAGTDLLSINYYDYDGTQYIERNFFTDD